MTALLELAFIVMVAVLFCSALYKSGILKSQKNKMDKAARDLNEQLRDPVADAEAAILEAGKSLTQLRQIRTEERTRLSKYNKLFETAQTNVEKWESLAQNAGSSDRSTKVEDVKRCLTNKDAHSAQAKEIQSKINASQARIDTLSNKITELESKIANAADKKQILELRKQQAEVDAGIEEQLKEIDTESLDGAFAKLEEDTMNAEARTEALQAESKDGTTEDQKLEQRYTAKVPDISDDRLKEYLKA